VPAALALALGGAVLTAAPASAAEAGLTVTAPAQNSTLESRDVTVTGSVFGGSTVIVYAADGTTPLARTNVGGTFGEPIDYSVQLPAYADDAPRAQSIKVGGLFGASGIPQVPVDFTLPTVAPVFSVTSPTEGETVDSRTVVFVGTGTDGSTVNVLDAAGDRVPGTIAAVVTDGVWTTTGTYSADAPLGQTVNVNQVTGGAGRGEATVNFQLPAAVLLAAPVITSPTEGQTVLGGQVTITGTGIAGDYIGVFVVPTRLLQESDPNRRAAAAEAAAPADPSDDIPVGADGTWSVTVALAPDAYTVIAFQADDPTGAGSVSAPSAPVNFILAAAPAAVAPGTTPTASGTTLAATGVDTNAFLGLGSLLALGGAALLIVRKRRLSSSF